MSGCWFVRLNNEFVFLIINILYSWWESSGQFELCFFIFFYNIIKVNQFLCCFIILFHLIFSFSLTRSFLVPYASVPTESIDCFCVFFVIWTILLISSVKSLCFLNHCCVCNFNFMFFMNSLWFFKYCLCQFDFLLYGLFYFQVGLLVNSFIIFKFKLSFYDKIFVSFALLSSLPSSIK